MNRIYKYEMPTTLDRFQLPIPETAKVLCVKEQNGKPYMWVELNDSHVTLGTRFFQSFYTGNSEIPENIAYIGTWFYEGLVFHTYDLMRATK